MGFVQEVLRMFACACILRDLFEWQGDCTAYLSTMTIFIVMAILHTVDLAPLCLCTNLMLTL
jgi:hypothetical protein